MPDARRSGRGVSVVLPVRNGAQWLDRCLTAILDERETADEPFEVIAVDDASTDSSPEILARFSARHGVRVLTGDGRGATVALNLGVAAARQPIICQVDQDVILDRGWVQRLVEALVADPGAAAAQAEYRAASDASIWARVTGLDLRLRWRKIHRGNPAPVSVDHVCSGNTAYRAAALDAVGGFDESLGYGYDNELSYRLGRAGHRLLLCGSARAVHHWPRTLAGYLRQQYGQGYGRLDLVARHPRRFSGDDVSNVFMVLHAPGMLAALVALAASPMVALLGGPGLVVALGGVGVVVFLALERLVTGLAAMRAFGDRAGLAFAPVHLLRDVAWAGAIVTWAWRRLTMRPGRPEHSMGRTAVD